MIIPIRCFSCNKLIADKYVLYLEEVNKIKESEKKPTTIDSNLINSGNIEKSHHGIILDNLDIKRYCCRRMFLGHTDISTNI